MSDPAYPFAGDEEEEVFDEPEEGDLVTEDHAKFYQDDKLVMDISVDATTEEMWAAIDAHMEKDQFWPNVFWISDHGNPVLMERPK